MKGGKKISSLGPDSQQLAVAATAEKFTGNQPVRGIGFGFMSLKISGLGPDSQQLAVAATAEKCTGNQPVRGIGFGFMSLYS